MGGQDQSLQYKKNHDTRKYYSHRGQRKIPLFQIGVIRWAITLHPAEANQKPQQPGYVRNILESDKIIHASQSNTNAARNYRNRKREVENPRILKKPHQALEKDTVYQAPNGAVLYFAAKSKVSELERLLEKKTQNQSQASKLNIKI